MKKTRDDYWEADFVLTCSGIDHVWSELTETAKTRIHYEFGCGKLSGELRNSDFK